MQLWVLWRFFGYGHRTVHQKGLHQLDVASRKFLRAVVRPLSNIDWSRPWHKIHHMIGMDRCCQSHWSMVWSFGATGPLFFLAIGNTFRFSAKMMGGSNGYGGGCRMDVIQLDVLDTTGLPNFQFSPDFCKWMTGKYWRKIHHLGSISGRTPFNPANAKLYSLR